MYVFPIYHVLHIHRFIFYIVCDVLYNILVAYTVNKYLYTHNTFCSILFTYVSVLSACCYMFMGCCLLPTAYHLSSTLLLLWPLLHLYTVYVIGSGITVLNVEVSLFQRCPLREVPLYMHIYIRKVG